MSGPDFLYVNSGGILSGDDNIQPATVQIGGTVTAGNVLTATLTVGGTAYPIVVTASAGQSLQNLVDAFIAAINATSALAALGITANQGNPIVMAFSFLCRRNGTALPTVAVSTSGGATLTLTILSQPQDILDAGPIWYLDRITSQPAKTGDNMGYLQFSGGSSTNPLPCVTYGAILGEVGNPVVGADLQGLLKFITAGYSAGTGNVLLRMMLGKGLQMFANSTAPTGGDKGEGTINLAGGYYKNGNDITVKPAFRATISQIQTGIAQNVQTRINYNVLGANTVAPYDVQNGRWTPPAGMVRLHAQILPGDTSQVYLFIVKNGTLPIAGFEGRSVDTLDYANGSDYYEAQVLFTGSGSHSIDAQGFYSFFEGHGL